MCHNIQDERYHTVCGHFIAMSTRLQDCLRADCLFSRRHEHSGFLAAVCKMAGCHRLMTLPQHNPIRISETKCGHCIMREHDGGIVGLI